MMKLQCLIATARSLFGDHRLSFSFVVFPFVRVVLFPSPAICWNCVAPQSNHLMELGQGTRLEGDDVLNASSPVSYAIPLLPSFLFFFFIYSFIYFSSPFSYLWFLP